MAEGGEIMRLPEGCISEIISFTSARDCCRSAVISTTFRSAAESDAVWDCFLPSGYEEILLRAVEPVIFSSKKELYFRLCDPILIDCGKMSFTLDRSTGHKRYTLSARALWITWGDTPDYWKFYRHEGSSFPEVAELKSVCWLEIKGKLDCKLLSRKMTYAAHLIFKLARDSYGLDYPKQDAWVRVGSHHSGHVVCLQPDNTEAQLRRMWWRRGEVNRPPSDVKAPRPRGDGWMEMELGEFFNEDGDKGDLEMYLQEVKGGNQKKGLIIKGIEVRPKQAAS